MEAWKDKITYPNLLSGVKAELDLESQSFTLSTVFNYCPSNVDYSADKGYERKMTDLIVALNSEL